ncbi:sulfatase [Acidobacteria bacterium AH-259-G07]|nr:sulfatase [Acidobacteria bacterium AH-259-G07]
MNLARESGAAMAAVVLAVGLSLFGTEAAQESKAGGRANVIIILADDLGYGDLGCYGNPAFESPHLDRMAKEGVRFTQFYVPVPYCAPSRATLLTGRYPFRNGIVFNPAPDSGINDVGIADEELTLGEAFQQAGYATSCIGKWHLGHKPQFYPRRHGFDEYYGILYSNDMRPVQLIENEKVIEYPVVQATLTKRYTERALQFIERHQNESFLLYLPHAMPHKPLAASEDFYKTSPAGLYGDVIAELDWSVGQILAKLKELGLEQNTLVIFASDNGPWYGGSTGGLRGMKSRTWEGGVRVPMIARWPGRIPPGRVCDEAAGMIDLFPTVLKLAGISFPADHIIDGKDIWPLMISDEAKSPHQALVAMQGPNLAIIRGGQWKLHVRSPDGVPQRGDDWVDPRGPDGVTILAPYEQARPSQYPGVTGGDGPEPMMLFNLKTDPAEQHNVARKHPDVVQRLKARFDQINTLVPEFRRPKRTPLQKPGPRPKR